MLTDIAGFAIWASVSDEVDAKIREQIKAGTFPVRLKPEDWQSGSVNWLLDVIAPDRKTAGRVIANFAQVVKAGELRLHPQRAVGWVPTHHQHRNHRNIRTNSPRSRPKNGGLAPTLLASQIPFEQAWAA